MNIPPCMYRDLSDDAVQIDPATGAQTRVDLWLCNWPTTLAAVPAWFRRRIGSGPAIDPDPDCINCPVRKEKQ